VTGVQTCALPISGAMKRWTARIPATAGLDSDRCLSRPLGDRANATCTVANPAGHDSSRSLVA